MKYQSNNSLNSLIILLIILVSCVKDLKTEIQIIPKLCFNCILNPDSVIKGSLSLSQSISETNTLQKVNDATIELKKDGYVLGIMKNSGKGIYRFESKPTPGCVYEVKISKSGYSSLYASTLIPHTPIVQYQKDNKELHNAGASSYYTFRSIYSINDQYGTNRYWKYNKRLTNGIWRFNGGYYGIDSPIFDDFNKVTDATDKYGFHYEYYLRINDTGLDGKMLTFSEDGIDGAVAFFLDADEHYDKYLKSSIKQMMNDGGNLLFNEPVQIYSNIENGLGIFGSAAITSFKL